MRALVLIGGIVVALLIAAGVYFVFTRVRLSGADEAPQVESVSKKEGSV